MITQTAKERPQGLAITWFGTVRLAETFLSGITFAELRRGIEKLPAGRRRRLLEIWLRDGVFVEYRARIFAVDEKVADLAGKIFVEAKRIGLNLHLTDRLIAATARVYAFNWLISEALK